MDRKTLWIGVSAIGIVADILCFAVRQSAVHIGQRG